MRMHLAIIAATTALGASVISCATTDSAHHGKQEMHMTSAAGAHEAPSLFETAPSPGTEATCPVAGKTFTVTDATVVESHNGRHYAFCCPGCQEKFDADPDKYAKQ